MKRILSIKAKLAGIAALAIMFALFLSCETISVVQSPSLSTVEQSKHSLQVKHPANAHVPQSNDVVIIAQQDAAIGGSMVATSEAVVAIIALLHFKQNEGIRPHIDLCRPLLLFEIFLSSFISPNAP